jgi:RNA polymerase sigma-70 factor (ECF subfamily)
MGKSPEVKIVHRLMLQDLVNGCRKGNGNAQRKIYEHFHGKMLAICMRYASCRDEAVEVLNMGFYKVFKNIHRFDDEKGNLEAWIRTIVVNTAIDRYRKEARTPNTIDIDNAWGEKSESHVVEQLTAEEIMKLVQELPPAYRTVFNLYAIEGFTHREIGEQLGISEGTSKSNLAKARKKLQKALSVHHGINKKQYVK